MARRILKKSELKESAASTSVRPKAKSVKTNGSTPVESIRHKDKRKNIPTEELRDFVAEEEQAPKTMLYPRDPSLDPQLVWKGKDEQDHEDLAVPVVPVYIQEKIHPQAIIDDMPRAEQAGEHNWTFLPTSTACRKSSTSVWTSIITTVTGRTA